MFVKKLFRILDMEIEDDYGHPEIEGCDGMQLAAYVPSNIPGKGCPEEFYQALASHCACNPGVLCPRFFAVTLLVKLLLNFTRLFKIHLFVRCHGPMHV